MTATAMHTREMMRGRSTPDLSSGTAELPCCGAMTTAGNCRFIWLDVDLAHAQQKTACMAARA